MEFILALVDASKESLKELDKELSGPGSRFSVLTSKPARGLVVD